MHENLQNQNPEGEIVNDVDNLDDSVHIADNAGFDSAVNRQERQFGDIDFQHIPETTELKQVAIKLQEQLITVNSLRENSTWIKFVTLPSATTKSVNTSTSAIIRTVIFKGMNV